MNRPVSPLLHDYKPIVTSQVRKSYAIPWFVLGLGLPFVGLALLLFLKSASGTSSVLDIKDLPEADPLHASDVPTVVENLVEEISPLDLSHMARLPEVEPVFDSIKVTVRRGDTMDRIFRMNKLDLGNLASIVRLPEAGKFVRRLQPGEEFEIKHDKGKIQSIYRKIDLTTALVISKADLGFVARIVDRPIDVRRRLAHGRIDSSLFESAASAGMPDKLIMNLAGIFAWDIDFVLDIRKGDDYYILFEEIYQDGRYISDGEIIAAEFNNNGRTFRALRYIDESGRSDYFTPEGRSVRKAFIRAPVDFTRISSRFNPRRKHPILNRIRAHHGVDYAAPRGTSIMAAGEGKVIFRGRKGGYGNVVILQHGGNITTLYGHMSRFANAARIGKRVKQGQTIGYVGSTGLTTAAHLHYEYRLNGVHRNPRTVKLPQAAPIKERYREHFLLASAPILEELDRYKRTQIVAARMP
ncbi:MAG: peptidoglycan DD-metalloendopeptidase family protein [Woeseia sp.]